MDVCESACARSKERVCVCWSWQLLEGGKGAPSPPDVSASRAETIKEEHSENKQEYEKILVSEL